MTQILPVKKAAVAVILLVLSLFLVTIQSCKKKRSDLAEILYKKTHNKVFKNVTPEGFAEAFKQVLHDEKSKLSNADFIASYYDENDYEPGMIVNHLFNNDLVTADSYFQKAGEHGLSSEMFAEEKLRTLINKFQTKKGIKTLDEAYHDMAELELTAANSLINYSNDLQYGVVNPKWIYQRYYTATKRPDSLSMLRVFQVNNMQTYLDSIQPKSPQYTALQKALSAGLQALGMSAEETKRVLLVNLERLRWRNKPLEDKYVVVNIPDYTLDVMDGGKSALNMKVCVGEGRNMVNANTLLNYNDTAKIDKPFAHETPQLNSLIYSVEVNPVWNIPQSIATKEIIVEAAKDRYYLANKNIEVYDNGKLVDDPEDIDWSNVNRENSTYEFKQKPGEDNSLGKIKFMFKNKSSVYLHDTPAKSAFYKKVRAISHGCVRLGDPQGLALSLFGPGDKYDRIVKDMGEDNPEPSVIYLPKKVPVYITYVTCWADEAGALQFRQDVYGLDIVLYDRLLKFLHPAS